MVLGRTDRGYDTFAYTGQYRVFTGTAHQLADIGTYGDAGFGDQLDTVLGYGCHRRCVNDFRIDRHLYRFEHVTSGQVNGCCHLEGQVNVCFGG